MKEQTQEIQNQLEKSIKEWNEILWMFDLGIEEHSITPDEYSDQTLLGAAKMFSHVLLNKLYFTPEGEQEIGVEEKGQKALELGTKIRELILEYALKDTHELIK